MAEYKNEEPCEFIYSITAIENVVDGDCCCDDCC